MTNRTIAAGCLVLTLLGSAFAGNSNPRGHLVIIGGGRRGPDIMSAFVRLAGGAKANIVLLPMASVYADSGIDEQIVPFQRAGAATVRHWNLTRAQAESDSMARALDGVTGVYFGGGDQSKLTAVLKGTKVEARLHHLYSNGAVIGGTSAGAAVMSRMMITGEERLNRDSSNAFPFIRSGNIVTAEGFGFLDQAIVDQHFIKRKRFNRLLSLVLEHPRLLGIGIDEATAIVVGPDRVIEVVGEATVLIIDAGKARHIEKDGRGNLAASDVQLHLLKAGDRFNLATRRILRK